jgi:hypothetical protein
MEWGKMGNGVRAVSSSENPKDDIKKTARDVTYNPAMETMARLGYGARGLVYAIIGLLALQVALGKGGRLTDTQGAIAFMGSSFIGTIFLYVILVGLVGYGLWGLVRAFMDPWHKGTDAKGIVMRIGYAISGISYLLLGWATLNIIRGVSSAQNGSQTMQIQHLARTILTKPWGVWVVSLVGLVIVASGVVQILEAVRKEFPQQFDPYALNNSQRRLISRLGRFGVAARGLVFSLIGLFLFLAAVRHNPAAAKGIDQVLASMLQQPYGHWLLGVVALGLIAFGIYSALSGFWLRLKR